MSKSIQNQTLMKGQLAVSSKAGPDQPMSSEKVLQNGNMSSISSNGLKSESSEETRVPDVKVSNIIGKFDNYFQSHLIKKVF